MASVRHGSAEFKCSKLGVSHNGVTKINYVKSLDSLNHQIAPLLLITIIENAFKHNSLNSEINIEIIVKDGALDLRCSNAYNDHIKEEKEFKIGLQNLEKRLHLLVSLFSP